MGSLAAVKLLLDTHIFLWSLLEPARLSERVSRELESHLNELWLSPIVIWEVLMLAERGRVALEPDAATWVRRACQAAPFREAPLNHEVAFQSRRSEEHTSELQSRLHLVCRLLLEKKKKKMNKLKLKI